MKEIPGTVPWVFIGSFSSDLIFPPRPTLKPKPKLERQPLRCRRLSGVAPETPPRPPPQGQNELGRFPSCRLTGRMAPPVVAPVGPRRSIGLRESPSFRCEEQSVGCPRAHRPGNATQGSEPQALRTFSLGLPHQHASLGPLAHTQGVFSTPGCGPRGSRHPASAVLPSSLLSKFLLPHELPRSPYISPIEFQRRGGCAGPPPPPTHIYFHPAASQAALGVQALAWPEAAPSPGQWRGTLSLAVAGTRFHMSELVNSNQTSPLV